MIIMRLKVRLDEIPWNVAVGPIANAVHIIPMPIDINGVDLGKCMSHTLIEEVRAAHPFFVR